MSPSAIIGHFEGAVLVGAENAGNCHARRQRAPLAQPLTFRYVRHTVAILMHGNVAQVTEQDLIGVLALAVVANAADSVVVDHCLCDVIIKNS